VTGRSSRTLVIETASAACSVALIEGDDVVAETHSVVGRGHAEKLLPMIAALPDGGRAAQVLVDCGPGSFTGVRVGLAAARALAFGWGATIAGYSSLPLIAASAFAAHADWTALAVVTEGGHGELFMQCFTAFPLAADAAARSLRPEAVLAALDGRPAVGSGLRFLRAVAPVAGDERLPRAADALLLPGTFKALPPVPIYVRAPDAVPMQA